MHPIWGDPYVADLDGSSPMVFRLVACLLLIVPLTATSAFAADYKSRAHDSHPEEAVVLDGLVGEVTLLKMSVRACSGEVCDDLQGAAGALASSMDELWRYVHAPKGKRDSIDDLWRDIEDHALTVDTFMPRSSLPEIDAVMREWAGTRERLARFKRTMRQHAGPGATASSR